jgi:small subunit ribosomal protein S11
MSEEEKENNTEAESPVDAKVEVDAKAEVKVEAQVETEAKVEAKVEAEAEVEPKAETKTKAKSKSKAKAKTTPNADADANAEAAVEEKKPETAEDLLKSDLEGIKIRKAKGSKNITSGIVNVLATFNNTKVTFTDPSGNVISWSSAGKCNFRGSRKSTAYAAQVVTQDAGRVAVSHGMKEVVVKLKGPGMGRDSAVRALQSLGIIVTQIVDVTPVPHNGCRPPKRRRV